MKSDGPSSEMYFQAVSEIAARALKQFGLTNFRLWCEGSGGEYGGEAITKYVGEQVQYASWIQSDFHVQLVLKFSRHKPFKAHLDGHASVQRVCAIHAMQDDVKQEGNRLATLNAPVYWKLRLVKANRFVVYGDFEEDDSLVDYKAKDPEIHEAKARLEAQYTAARLPVPEIVLVGFNMAHEEVKS